MLSSLVGIVAFLVLLGVLIFVHELGHFLAAKWSGMYVARFSIGMGPTIPWLTWQRGETEYTVSWLPLGGYVKVMSREEAATSAALEGGGDNLPPIPADRMFEAKPVWKRMIFVLAGVVFNTVFAWLLYVGLEWKTGRQTLPITAIGAVHDARLPKGAEALRTIAPGTHITTIDGQRITSWNDIQTGVVNADGDEVAIGLDDGRTITLRIHPDALGDRLQAFDALEPFLAPVVGVVDPSKPAGVAGMQVGDTLVAVAGQPIRQWTEAVKAFETSGGKPIDVEIGRATGRQVLHVTPNLEYITQPDRTRKPVGKIGVAAHIDSRTEPYTFTQAIAAGTRTTWESAFQIVRTVKGMAGGRISSRELGGPILIGQVAGQSLRAGLDVFLGYMALISVNLAVLNLLPIPVLDGGQFLFLLAEAVARRPLPLVVRERLTLVGLAMVLLLMVFAFSNDLRRFFGA